MSSACAQIGAHGASQQNVGGCGVGGVGVRVNST